MADETKTDVFKCIDEKCRYPEKPHYARGLCYNCWRRKRYAESPKIRARACNYAKSPKARAYNAKWQKENKDQLNLRKREWYLKKKWALE